MKKYSFCYDMAKKTWRECQHPLFQCLEIGTIPWVPIVACSYERTGTQWKKAWCEKHHAYEEVLDYGEDSVKTEMGCHLEGWPVALSLDVWQTEDTRSKSSRTVRWQVVHDPEDNTVKIFESSISFLFVWVRDKSSGEFLPMPVLEGCQQQSCMAEDCSRFHWYPPNPVMECALAAQKEEMSKSSGSPSEPPSEKQERKEEKSGSSFLDKAKESDHLDFYCQWLRRYFPEAKLADRLYAEEKNWRAWKDDAFKGFRLYFNRMPAEWKEELLENGMTSNTHSRLVLLHQEYASRQEDLRYEDHVRSWECKINDYNFRLISSIHRFQQVFLNMSYSFHSHRNIFDRDCKELQQPHTALFLLERNGRYLAFIELRENKVVEAYMFDRSNDILNAKCSIVIQYWMKQHGFIWECNPVSEDPGPLLEQEFVVEPADRDEWEDRSLLQMLHMEQTAIRPGYYLQYCRKLAECALLHAKVPSPEEDEKDYLTRNFPWGKPIYDAAFAGNPEAQYAMSLLYRDGYCFQGARFRQAYEWYQRAMKSGWLEIAPAKRDVRLEDLHV